jgi:hypothetical protein
MIESASDIVRGLELAMEQVGAGSGCIAIKKKNAKSVEAVSRAAAGKPNIAVKTLDNFYPAGHEPSEPNSTALLDPDNVKWKRLLSEGIEIPTPWEKADYDEADLAWQEERRRLNDRIAELRRSGAPEAEMKAAEAEYERRDREHTERMHEFLEASRFAGKVGAFEGAGYASTGLYRPMVDCIMFSKGTSRFCLVCREAMKRVIDRYSR